MKVWKVRNRSFNEWKPIRDEARQQDEFRAHSETYNERLPSCILTGFGEELPQDSTFRTNSSSSNKCIETLNQIDWIEIFHFATEGSKGLSLFEES